MGVKQGPVLRLTSGSLEVDYEDLCDLTRDLCLMLPFGVAHYEFILMLQKNPEGKSVRDEQ